MADNLWDLDFSSWGGEEKKEAEQACITIDRGIYDFYKEYFDGIITIAKE